MERKSASDYPQELLDLFHEYQHGDIDRRTFLDRAAKFAVGGLTVATIFESLRPNYAWAQQVPADDKRIKVGYETVQSPEGNGSIKGYLARPSKNGKQPAVLVIHENRGLNDHIRDVARRLGLAGFRAVAPDFLSPSGGTPANEDAARDAIGKLDLTKSVSNAVAMLDELAATLRDRQRVVGMNRGVGQRGGAGEQHTGFLERLPCRRAHQRLGQVGIDAQPPGPPRRLGPEPGDVGVAVAVVDVNWVPALKSVTAALRASAISSGVNTLVARW